MNVEEAVIAFRNEGRFLTWEGEALEHTPYFTRRYSRCRKHLTVSAFGLTDSNADQAIRNEIADSRFSGCDVEWKIYSFDSPPDLIERLRYAGLCVGEREALVLYDLRDGMEPFEGPASCQVERIVRIEQLGAYQKVAESAFGADRSGTVGQLANAIQSGTPGHDGYIAWVDGVPASVGRLYTDPNSLFAGLYGGGTHPAFRHRGCYRAVVAARALDAAKSGARYLLVDAMPTSLPILLKLGFHHLADTWPCSFED
jgi:hypothetical protein